MANVVKIYDLKTLGYPELIAQLKEIEASFQKIKAIKRDLNNQKYDSDDVQKIQAINRALSEEKIKAAELRLERQRLRNEIAAGQAARQAEINASRQSTAANAAEAGSINDLIRRAKELQAILRNKADSGGLINFEGNQLSRQQAIAQFQELNKQAGILQANMKGVGQTGSQSANLIANAFGNMKNQLSQMIFMYTGWFAAFQGAGQLLASNVRLSDSFADLQIRIKGTKEETEALFNELKKLDTRTSLAGLVDIANVVAKKGVAKSEIAALTAEFDKLNVVLGGEIGDPAHATANIIKLISIFEEDKNVTAERVAAIGSSLFKLTTSGVATGEFLVNFAERVGAVRGITGLTLPNILGMGAALQQLGQRTEVAGTAATQLTTMIFSNVDKFSRAAGVSIQEFRKLLDENPFEALVQVGEGLRAMSDDVLAAEFEEVIQAFGDVNVTGQRIKAVLGDIATNADFVRDKMAKAAVSTGDLAAQTAAAELKQHTFAATLERIRKALETAFVSEPVRIALGTISSLILLITNNLGVLITVLAVYATAWSIANVQMIAATVATRALAIATTFQNAVINIATVFTKAYTVALAYLTGGLTGATAASRLLTIAMRLLPIGIVITLIAILTAGCARLASEVKGTSEALRRQAEQMRINAEITDLANEKTSAQISKLNELVAIVLDTNVSLTTQQAVMEELITINGKFAGAMDKGVISATKLRDILKEVTVAIQANARAAAASELAAGKLQDVQDIAALRQRFERLFAKGGTIMNEQLPENQLRIMKENLQKLGLTGQRFDLFFNQEGFDITKESVPKFRAFFDALEKEVLTTYDDYLTAATKFGKEAADINAKNQVVTDKIVHETLLERIKTALNTELTGDELQNLITAINRAIDKEKEGSAVLLKLVDARKEFEKRLKELRGKEAAGGKTYTGAKVGGLEKDAIAEIEASRKLDLAEREKDFAALQSDHRATLEEELQFVEDIRAINVKYVEQKIRYLESQKSLNVKEKELLATFRKERYDLELKAQNDRQVLLDREFQLQRRNAKAILDNAVRDIELKQKELEEDQSVSATTKAEAKLAADTQILALQEKFNADMDILEKKFNQKSIDNTEQGFKTKRDLLEDARKILEAMFKDANDAADKLNAEFQIKAAEQTMAILNSNASPANQAKQIQEIRNKLARDLLASQAALLKIELELYEKGARDKLKTEADYQRALAKYKEMEVKVTENAIETQISTTERFIRALRSLGDQLAENLLGLKKYTDDAEGKAQRSADAIAQAYETIDTAISEAFQNYFDIQAQRIDVSLDAHQERLDMEEEQVKARATSQAEIASIEKQYDAKRKELERQAGEDRKKLALKQLAIEYAVAVMKSIAQYGLPFALIPIAAASVLYAIQRSNINSQKFERGGKIAPTETGGRVKGPSHAGGGVKFAYEAEGDELMIINKRSAKSNKVYSITGTPSQIASQVNELGGGIRFDGGARLKRFAEGGFLGTGYPAPVYKPSGFGTDEDFKAEIRNLAVEQSRRIDRIQVVQVTDTVTNAQNKRVKQNQIGILP